jgi:glycosyltransferase involved in cell wall biosynthesis
MRRLRRQAQWDVAIHAPLSAALYRPNGADWTGGAELQAHYIARALAERGLRVAHIVDEDPALPSRSHGVDLVREQSARRGPRGTRRVRVLWDVLSRADASVYLQRSAGVGTGLVGAFARSKRRRFIYSLSSSVDLERGPLPRIDTVVKDAGLRLADCIVTQTAEQQAAALTRLGEKAVLIRSFCEPRPQATRRELFLWVGGLIDYKRPLAYLAVASQVTEAEFVMVGTPRPGWDRLADEVRNRAEGLSNMRLVGARPRHDLAKLYERSVAIVNTSKFEGFPNTLMEAWASGVPALSLAVDPDGVIERYKLGAVAGDSVGRLVALTRSYWNGRLTASAPGEAARQYVRREHAPAVIGDKWMDVVSALL